MRSSYVLTSLMVTTAIPLGRCSRWVDVGQSRALGAGDLESTLQSQERSLDDEVGAGGDRDAHQGPRQELHALGECIQPLNCPEPPLMVEIEGIRDRPQIAHQRQLEPRPEGLSIELQNLDDK